MAKKTTRDAALSRLFGASPETPGAESGSDPQRRAPDSGGESLPLDVASTTERPDHAPAQPDAPTQSLPQRTTESASATLGYIGRGRYVRETGVMERITPYVRPDQAEALRVAVARKSDPRGKDISEIVQSLLDEAGYGSSQKRS